MAGTIYNMKPEYPLKADKNLKIGLSHNEISSTVSSDRDATDHPRDQVSQSPHGKRSERGPILEPEVSIS